MGSKHGNEKNDIKQRTLTEIPTYYYRHESMMLLNDPVPCCPQPQPLAICARECGSGCVRVDCHFSRNPYLLVLCNPSALCATLCTICGHGGKPNVAGQCGSGCVQVDCHFSRSPYLLVLCNPSALCATLCTICGHGG
ncbi:hypothetical protein J6590_035505 [Homalodisca vitripennis]|nr:hypothetical protein J6590_035505 [Homalodisca vitripennis]